jgi:hypothetical protein
MQNDPEGECDINESFFGDCDNEINFRRKIHNEDNRQIDGRIRMNFYRECEADIDIEAIRDNTLYELRQKFINYVVEHDESEDLLKENESHEEFEARIRDKYEKIYFITIAKELQELRKYYKIANNFIEMREYYKIKDAFIENIRAEYVKIYEYEKKRLKSILEGIYRKEIHEKNMIYLARVQRCMREYEEKLANYEKNMKDDYEREIMVNRVIIAKLKDIAFSDRAETSRLHEELRRKIKENKAFLDERYSTSNDSSRQCDTKCNICYAINWENPHLVITKHGCRVYCKTCIFTWMRQSKNDPMTSQPILAGPIRFDN